MLSLDPLGVPLIFSCPRDYVFIVDWQPRSLLGIAEARPVNNVNTDRETHELG